MDRLDQAAGCPEQADTPAPSALVRAERLAVWLETHSTSALAAVLVMTFLAAVAYGRAKPLWFDEIFSVIVARTHGWAAMKVAMSADGNPPLFALLIRLCLRLFGHSDFAARLPSLAGFLFTVAAVYAFVRRETCGLVALLASVLVLAEPGWTYAFEARPYALLMGWMMLGLLSWQAAVTSGRNRRLGLAGIWLAFVLGMLTHNLGLIEVGLPLVFGEVARSLRLRRVDWPVWIAGACSLPVLLFTAPLAKATNHLLLSYSRMYTFPLDRARFLAGWVHQPLQSLLLLLSAVVVSLLAAILLLYSSRENFKAWLKLPAAWAALGATLLIPATYLIMMSTSGYYNCRYGIGSVAGIAMLFSLLYARSTGNSRKLTSLIFFAVIVTFLLGGLRAALRRPVAPTRLPSNIDSGEVLAIADPFQMMPAWYYAAPAERRRIVYLRDQPDAIKGHYIVVDVSTVTVAAVTDVQIADITDFLKSHNRFLFMDDDSLPARSIAAILKANGYTLQPQAGTISLASRE